jgi:amino acid permease
MQNQLFPLTRYRVPYNDPALLDAIATGSGVAYSPFIVGMLKHGLNNVLPHIVNFLVLTSAASCGNGKLRLHHICGILN